VQGIKINPIDRIFVLTMSVALLFWWLIPFPIGILAFIVFSVMAVFGERKNHEK